MNLNRRQVLWAGSGIGAAALLAACGGGDGTSSKSPAKASGKPRSGGTLRVGALGRASAITRDPHGTQTNESDYLIISLVYDTLTVPGAKPSTVPRLAAGWQASDDLKTWRFTLATGAKFHWTRTRLRPLTSMCPAPSPGLKTRSSMRASTISIPSVRDAGISLQTRLKVPDWNSKVIASETTMSPP